jgi:Glycosyl transferase family 2
MQDPRRPNRKQLGAAAPVRLNLSLPRIGAANACQCKPYATELIMRINPRTVLDVGPGVGTYGSIIRKRLEVDRLDAVEIWAPYIEQYWLKDIYDNVIVADVRYWHDFEYDLIILGDVLEHLALDDAVVLWKNLSKQAGAVHLSIPIVHYSQGPAEGNPYETHIVADWSTSSVLEHLDGIQEYREFGTAGVFLALFRKEPSMNLAIVRGSSPSQFATENALSEGNSASSVSPAFLATDQDAGLPLVSCFCPTFNRPPDHQYLLEEAIESFLRQTYPNKELIVLNDCPEQELVCDAPGVRVINAPERFPTLGEKRNAAIALARGELLAPWDDDDISLPWRLSLSVERLGTDAYYNPRCFWFLDRSGLHFDHYMATSHAKSLFTRDGFATAGGYPSISLGDDIVLHNALTELDRNAGRLRSEPAELARSEWYYIYRWGISPIHTSSRDESGYQEIGSRPVQPGRYILRPHWRIDYEAETGQLLETVAPTRIAVAGTDRAISANPSWVAVEASPHLLEGSRGRAIVCFVEDKAHLVQQLLALRLSWLNTDSPDTDLVVMGPAEVLARLPDDLVKIPQRPAADDPVWGGYRYINALACLNGAGAEQLDRYSHLLRTDVDTFLTPAWNAFYPTAFTFGNSTYANDDVPQRIQTIATAYGLTHRGMTNIHTTWYGATAVVRRAAAFAEMLTKHLLTHEFAVDAGEWPGWYRGVATRYAGEIAVNHCASDAQRSALLDAPSTSTESIARYPHIHCWHTDQLFSKHRFMGGGYTREDAQDLNLDVIRDYCLKLSLRSREALAPVP